MKRGVCVRQHDVTDCAAACLASVAAYYESQIPVARIRQIAHTDRYGTNFLGMVEAAQKLGFAAKGVKAYKTEAGKQIVNIQSLKKIPLPAIAHVIVDGRLLHFVVIYKISKDKIWIMDPAVGKVNVQNITEFSCIWTGMLLLLVPDEDFVKRNEKVSIISRFWFLFKPHRKMFVQALFGSLIYTAIGLISAICIQKIIDYVIPDRNFNLLHLICVILTVSTLLSVFINFVRSKMMMHAGIQVNTRLMLGYYRHLLKLPQSFFDSMRSGEILSRMVDAARINAFINGTFLSIVINVFTVLVSFSLMFSYYWKLALIMLVSIPVYFVMYYFYNKVNKVVKRKIMEQGADMQSQLVETINAAGTIKRFGIEDYANLKTEEKFVTLTRTGWNSGMYDLNLGAASGLFSGFFSMVLFWSGTSFVLDGVITPGELMSFNSLTGYFMSPVIALLNVNNVFQETKIAAERLFEIFDREQEDDEQCKIPFSRVSCGSIVFHDITFRYGSREIIFEHFNIEFPAGKVSAIVGESGSGKSTIVALIQNLYPLVSGKITVGGINIKHVRTSDLRSVIIAVPQRIDLFNGSIAGNILLDDLEPDWERLNGLCKDLGITDFADRLPQGLKTYIGENGMQLSGGQRQRIAIARALYRNPEILILDEATSALDSESEEMIKNMIEVLRGKNKTIILIAHRLSTIKNADEIFLLKDGKLKEQGSHHELMKCNGEYSKLWKLQAGIV
ncbi:peptidase domain-containing ABC transporter [uncultured Butyricimonas sp.]|uniref:peptidase domain-containing ABC transporter n=1 Tax=uncultured Butyricimonas sp. TaxID=1268785 RepID=UPI0026DA767F|nr:peptidase domain-containing ABC transporter [uncultured Butyricimonas sp.]